MGMRLTLRYEDYWETGADQLGTELKIDAVGSVMIWCDAGWWCIHKIR